METYQIISTVSILIAIILLILIQYKVKYKGKCIIHNWEYKFEYGNYWKVTGTFVKTNRRYVCKKCNQIIKEN